MISNVWANVRKGANLMTDEVKGYCSLTDGYHYHTVEHGADEYVRRYFIHTNGFENAWSLFKPQVSGIHHFQILEPLPKQAHFLL